MPTILVIEDEPSIRDNIADLLEASGYEPIKATDGQAGIEKARRYAPDVIVCDVMMPHTDGHEVLHAIREDDALAATPFIFLTARSTRDDLREGMDGGADDYVTKPFRTADLLNAIEARLDRREAIEEEQERQLDNLRHTISAILPHELRTPLMGIEGYSQLLMADWDELDGAEARDLLGEVVASSNRLKQLIENYILYARLAAGLPVETPAEPTSVGEIVRLKAEDLAGNHDRLSDLQLTIEPGQVSLSSALFAKLIRELIDNAFRFSDAGTPVHIRGERIGDQYRLVIRDSGRGMTADQLKRIGAFVQFDRHEFEQQGSGLGLTIAREIIDHSEGALNIESTSGRGTTVTAQLPLAKPVAPDAAAKSSRHQPAR